MDAHPITKLRASDGEAALAKLRAVLDANRGNVTASAAALTPPVHEVTLHHWITNWGLRAWLKERWPLGGRARRSK